MKVEIDADELCRLRGEAGKNGKWLQEVNAAKEIERLREERKKNSFVTVVLPGGRKVRFRGGTTIRADTYENFLACVGGTVARRVEWSDERYSRLEEERDWWRSHAIRLSRLIDEREEIIMDSHYFRQKDGWDSHVNSLITYAELNGYEVPE